MKSNMRENWRALNHLMGKRISFSSVEVVRGMYGEDVRDPLSIDNLFCNYFSSVAQILNNNIPTSNINPMNYMPNPTLNSFYAAHVSVAEVVDVIAKLPNTSGNIHSVPVFAQKRSSNILAHTVAYIFNSSITEGVFPELLKISRVVPVYKSESSKYVWSHHPIAVLQTLSKIIEKPIKI